MFMVDLITTSNSGNLVELNSPLKGSKHILQNKFQKFFGAARVHLTEQILPKSKKCITENLIFKDLKHFTKIKIFSVIHEFSI